jgi:hypothetical protein
MPAGDTDTSLLAPRVSGVSVVQRPLAMSRLSPAGYTAPFLYPRPQRRCRPSVQAGSRLKGWPRADRRRTCLTGRNQPAVITHERSLKRVSPNRLRHKAGPARHVRVVPTGGTRPRRRDRRQVQLASVSFLPPVGTDDAGRFSRSRRTVRRGGGRGRGGSRRDGKRAESPARALHSPTRVRRPQRGRRPRRPLRAARSLAGGSRQSGTWCWELRLWLPGRARRRTRRARPPDRT